MEKTNVLIVEDELIIALDLKNILKKLGYNVPTIARNADSAINAIDEFQPQMVLLDIIIQGDKNGIEVARLLHSEYKIPFVVITSHSDKEILAKAMETKPYGYLIKPFDDEEVQTTLKHAISTWQKEQVLMSKPLKQFRADDYIHEKDNFFIRDRGMLAKVRFSEIISLEADGNYTLLFTTKTKYALRTTLGEVENRLPKDKFLRIHKSHVVNLDSITAVNTQVVFIGEKQIPIGRSYYRSLMGRLNLFSAD